MRFGELSGNEPIVKALAGMVDSGRVPHAIMLHENDGGGGFGLAMAFLQYLYCSSRSGSDSCGVCPNCNKISKLIHPDVHFVFPVMLSSGSASTVSPSEAFLGDFRTLAIENPCFTEQELYGALGFEGKNPVISVAEANALLRSLSLYSLEGGFSSVVVLLPEKMNLSAANKLLKMLEEPPAQTLFILVTHAPERLLPTIVSRCQMFRVASPLVSAAASYDDSGMLASLMEALLSRDLSSALSVGEQLAALPSRESAKGFCRYAAEKFRRVFLCQQGLAKLSDSDAEAAGWAASLNPRFSRKALEVLDRTMQRIDRNVNLKILFTDLVNRLYINI
jgi:DNA polymerase-3 subunit delta'